jgi:polyisoprenoid-binding protein YceI
MKPLLALAALLLASTASAGAYVVDPSASVVKFHLHHKMHEVDGKSSQIEGKAILQDDGKVLTMIRIPVTSFDTADANRDSHMRETLEAAKFPFVVFKGVTGLTVPVATGKGLPAKLEGELEFHGVKQPLSVPAEIVFGADGSATVHAKFPVNLEAHKIERPSLLFIKVDENVQLDVSLKLKAAK